MTCSLRRAGVLAVLASFVLLALAGVAAAAAPSNDDYASPVELTGVTGDRLTSNVGASTQADEPNGSAYGLGQTVWFTWVAPDNGTLDLGANGEPFGTWVCAFTGDTAAVAEAQACAAGGVHFDVTRGTRYHFSVDTTDGDGDFYLN
jgi:hypothetical protein